MKSNKIFLTLGAISIVPVFLSTIINLMIGMMYWSDNVDDKMKFYIGKCNNEFISLINIFGIFGMAFIITAIMITLPHSDDIDKLEDSIKAYQDAKKSMEEARNKYAEQLLKK